jgi:arylsulfatase A-like enzyme/tetratricopeptide (TPR) repeat protein
LSRPFRYTFILVLAALSTALAAVSGWRYARASAPINGPIILIAVDSLRADHLPAYGYTRVKTPGIDRLATDGVVFERAFSHVPQTLPAVAALLTGRLPYDTGVRDSVGLPLAQSERLLPEMLRDRGYSTAAIVSSFLLRKETGINQGFNLFDANFTVSDDAPLALRRDPLDAEAVAEHWLDSIGSQRTFLFLHLDGPHPPYRDVASGFSRTSPGASTDRLSSYDTAVVAIDEVVGRLVQYLKSHQLYDQAAIVLVASHGEGLGDHGENAHGLLTYDEALRIPLIVKPPAGERAGRRVKIAVQQVDLVPTILNLAKAPLPGNLRGRSLTPLLDRDGIIANQLIYSESLYGFYHFGWAELTSLTDGRYRYIHAPKEELYDLDTDPKEQRNLVDTDVKMVEAFRKGMKTFAAPATPKRIEMPNDEDRERYEMFGYVGTPLPAGGDRGAGRAGEAEGTRAAGRAGGTTTATNAVSGPSSRELVNPIDKRDVVERYRRAINLLTTDDLKAAIDQLKALATQEPSMRDVWMLLATAGWKADRPEVALDGYQHAIELDPASSDAYLGASSALLRLHRFDDAAARAQHVVDDSETTEVSQSRAHELLAQVALARKNLELAHAEAMLAEEAEPSRPVTAFIDGRIAFDKRRYAEALELLEPALEVAEKTPRQPLGDLRVLTAEAFVKQDRLSEAEYLFLEELKQSPLSERARAGLIAVYKATGRTTEAAALAQR